MSADSKSRILSAMYSNALHTSTSLVGFWKINEGGSATTVLDSSIYGDNGTWENSNAPNNYTSPGQCSTYCGNFVFGSPVYNYVLLNSVITVSGDFTLCLWSYILGSNLTEYMAMGYSPVGGGGFAGWVDSGKFSVYITLGGYTNGNTVFTQGVWEHWAVTRISNTFAFYHNGSYDGAGIASYTGQIRFDVLGGDPVVGPPYYMYGYLNNIRAYNRGLSALEINNLYITKT